MQEPLVQHVAGRACPCARGPVSDPPSFSVRKERSLENQRHFLSQSLAPFR